MNFMLKSPKDSRSKFKIPPKSKIASKFEPTQTQIHSKYSSMRFILDPIESNLKFELYLDGFFSNQNNLKFDRIHPNLKLSKAS